MTSPTAHIEIVEHVPAEWLTHPPVAGHGVVKPSEVRINGIPVLIPADDPITVHETVIGRDDVVKVTLTLFAHHVRMGFEDQDEKARLVAQVAAHQKAIADLSERLDGLGGDTVAA